MDTMNSAHLNVTTAVSRMDRYDRETQNVNKERGANYGPPSVDFDRAARIKAVLAECPDPLVRHTLEMIAVKMARLIQTPDHLDSWIDIAGYARCGVSVTDPRDLKANPRRYTDAKE